MPLTWSVRFRNDVEGVTVSTSSSPAVVDLPLVLELHSDFPPHFVLSDEQPADDAPISFSDFPPFVAADRPSRERTGM
jgi:hypothetical protein